MNLLKDTMKQELMNALKQYMRPEFLNRIDDIIVFRPLTEKQIQEVVVMQFNIIKNMLKHNDIDIEMTPDAVDYIAKISYDPLFGARPVKRMMQKELLNDLSKMLLSDKVNKDTPIIVDANDKGLVFKN